MRYCIDVEFGTWVTDVYCEGQRLSSEEVEILWMEINSNWNATQYEDKEE